MLKYRTSRKDDFMKRKFKKNVIVGLIMIATSIGYSFVLGCIFSLIGLGESSFVESLPLMSKTMFWMFGAGLAAGGVLSIVIPAISDHCVGFGCALYYGTVFISGFLDKFIIADQSDRLLIAFVFVSLLCYIYWLKNLKPSE